MYDIDKNLLKEIDSLELSEKNKAWRKAMREAPWRVFVERERLAVESWKESAWPSNPGKRRRARIWKSALRKC